MIEILVVLVLIGVSVGMLVAIFPSAGVERRSSMEEAARREHQRVGRAQAQAECEINRLTHAAFEEMLDEVDRARRGADS